MHLVYLDDEPIHHLRFESELQKLDRELSCSYFQTTHTALEHCEQHQPDFVFLDIVLSEGDSLGLAGKLSKKGIPFAFLSTHNDRARQAFRLGAVNYLLKPVSALDIETTFSRLEKANTGTIVHKLETTLTKLLSQNLATANTPTGISIRKRKELCFLAFDDIAYVGSKSSFTKFITRDGREVISMKQLKTHEKQLMAAPDLIRVHRSYFINRKYVRSVRVEADETILAFDNGFEISISPETRVRIVELLEQYISGQQ